MALDLKPSDVQLFHQTHIPQESPQCFTPHLPRPSPPPRAACSSWPPAPQPASTTSHPTRRPTCLPSEPRSVSQWCVWPAYQCKLNRLVA